MRRVRTIVKGSVTALVGVGLVATNPILTVACANQGHQEAKVKSHDESHGNDNGGPKANVHLNEHGNRHFGADKQVNVYVNSQSNGDCGCQTQVTDTHSKGQSFEHGHGDENVHMNTHVNEHSNIHVNTHVNEHTNVHVNTHVNEHSNVHVNSHVNEHTNVHMNTHVNEHSNVHDNAHVNEHSNEHVNTHVNEHSNVHENVHTNTHVNEHTNVHVNIHNKVELEAYQLEVALQDLGCTQSDYLYAYLQSVHIGHPEAIQIHQNLQRVNDLCAHFHATGTWNYTQKHEVLRLFISCVSAMHLTASFVDSNGHPCDVLGRGGHEHIVIQLKDQSGNSVSTIPTTVSRLTSPSQVQVTIREIDTTAQNAKKLSDTGKFVAQPVIHLPKTATQDPLWMVIGFMLMIVGGLAVIPAVKLTNRRK